MKPLPKVWTADWLRLVDLQLAVAIDRLVRELPQPRGREAAERWFAYHTSDTALVPCCNDCGIPSFACRCGEVP
jgi:hypothetical protein